MSLFRNKQAPQTSSPPVAAEPAAAATQSTSALFDGPRVDMPAVYNAGQVSREELDRVSRAEGLLQLLPRSASQTRAVVDATLKAFGVDRQQIVDAANRQLGALEGFIRTSHDHTQRQLDATAKRIAELEGEIERCRQAGAQATHEGEERARTANSELVKVQRVLDFFEGETVADEVVGLEQSTIVKKPSEVTPH